MFYTICSISCYPTKACHQINMCKKTIYTNMNYNYLSTSNYCSRIIVVHVHATFFLKFTQPQCHNIANGIKPGSDPKKTDKHVADCSKAVCWGVK